ncbi:hypothetical protein [Ferrovibrio sp.]|uniref:hypothetical protein n=1 Tax=Ferrovibrio sp. TaxID=1917215 RepID=UPI0035B38ECF
MVRYRELRTIAQLEREFPYIVEVPIPPGGLGRRLDKLEAWLAIRIERKDFGRWGRWRDGRDIAVWAFREPAIASAFQRQVSTIVGPPVSDLPSASPAST